VVREQKTGFFSAPIQIALVAIFIGSVRRAIRGAAMSQEAVDWSIWR
jgi:hypothetical protein